MLCGFYVLLLYRRGVVTEATASPALRGYALCVPPPPALET